MCDKYVRLYAFQFYFVLSTPGVSLDLRVLFPCAASNQLTVQTMLLLQVTFHPYLDQNENRYQALGHGKEQETFEAGLERGNIWLMGI